MGLGRQGGCNKGVAVPDLPLSHEQERSNELIAAFRWHATGLGPVAQWPGHVRNTVALMLRSPVPMAALFGEAGIMIYNDAYSVFAGGRHPRLLGSPVRQRWPEVADFNDHVMRVDLGGDTLSYKDQELTLYRRGVPEQVWMNLDYSPILGDDGRPAAVFAIVVETTDKVRAEQRLAHERSTLYQMFEQAPGFICTLRGPDHVFEFATRLTGSYLSGRCWGAPRGRPSLRRLRGDQHHARLCRTAAHAVVVAGRPAGGPHGGLRMVKPVEASALQALLRFAVPSAAEDADVPGASGVYVGPALAEKGFY